MTASIVLNKDGQPLCAAQLAEDRRTGAASFVLNKDGQPLCAAQLAVEALCLDRTALKPVPNKGGRRSVRAA